MSHSNARNDTRKSVGGEICGQMVSSGTGRRRFKY
jgi:hypothetical protein